jgi:hypothetical protein
MTSPTRPAAAASRTARDAHAGCITTTPNCRASPVERALEVCRTRVNRCGMRLILGALIGARHCAVRADHPRPRPSRPRFLPAGSPGRDGRTLITSLQVLKAPLPGWSAPPVMQRISQRSTAMVTVADTQGLLSVPDPQFPRAGFPRVRFPASRRSSMPEPPFVPGGQPDPRCLGAGSGVTRLRWACGLDQRLLHLPAPGAVLLVITAGHAQAVCGHPIPAQGLTLTSGRAQTLCTACLIGTTRERTVPPGAPSASPGDLV